MEQKEYDFGFISMHACLFLFFSHELLQTMPKIGQQVVSSKHFIWCMVFGLNYAQDSSYPLWFHNFLSGVFLNKKCILNPLVYCLHSEDFRVISTEGITIKKKRKKIISFGLLIKNCGNIQLAGKSPKHFLLMCFCSQIPFFWKTFHTWLLFSFFQPCI